jgi:hypothetical protein
MLRVDSLSIPNALPHPSAIRSWGDNEHSYEPEFWEFQYEMYRYLGRVQEQELTARYKALVRNIRALVSADRHVIPIRSFLSSWYWYRKEHQTRLEFSMRHLALPCEPPAGVIDNSPVNAPARPSWPNAGDILFRYGNRTYMDEMVAKGRVRVGAASYYRRIALGAARADEELEKSSFLPGQYTRITLRDGRSFPINGDMRRTVAAPNYYTVCMSCDWDPALHGDFGADACVVLRAPKEFAHRLDAAAKSQLEGWYFHHNPVEYFDPYEMSKNQYFNAGMCKDFQFAYQREYRFLWIHLHGQEASGFRYLDLGPLDDIADLHIQ